MMASWHNVCKILTVLGVEISFEGPLMAEFERAGVQAIEEHFHALIRDRAGEFLAERPFELPELSHSIKPDLKRWLSIPGLAGGFQYWFAVGVGERDGEAKLIVESWNREVPGSEARHEITSEGSVFVGRIINGVDFSGKSSTGID